MMAYSKGAKRRARRARAAEGHTDMPGLAETPKRKRDGRFAESTRRPAEDPRVVAFNARIRHFGPSVDAASVMLADPAGQAIHIGGSDFFPIMMGQKSWDDVKGNFDGFVPDLLNNLVWWTNATKTAREADAAAATKAA